MIILIIMTLIVATVFGLGVYLGEAEMGVYGAIMMTLWIGFEVQQAIFLGVALLIVIGAGLRLAQESGALVLGDRLTFGGGDPDE